VKAVETNCRKMAKTTAKNIIKDIIIVAVGVAAIWIGLQVVFGTQNPFYVVSSGSMIPVLEVYDVLVVDGKVPFNDIQMGDIIVFNRPNGHDRVIVHRVAAILDDNPKTIRTKGDANPISIPGTDYPITKDEYIGKVAYIIPQIGYVTRILTPPINYIIIAVIIGIMIVKQYTKGKKDTTPKFGTEPQKDFSLENEEFTKQNDVEYNDPKNDIIEPDDELRTNSDKEASIEEGDSVKKEDDQNKS
jgi:signal peptidase